MTTAVRLELLGRLGAKDLSPRERFDCRRADFFGSNKGQPREKDGKFAEKGAGSKIGFGKGNDLTDEELDAAEEEMWAQEQALSKAEDDEKKKRKDIASDLVIQNLNLDFDEAKHTRAKDGKFGKKGAGPMSAPGQSQPAMKTPKVDKKGARAINTTVNKVKKQTKKPLKNPVLEGLKAAAIVALVYTGVSVAATAGIAAFSAASQYKKQKEAVKATEGEWFETLGVGKDADYATVKKAYKDKARKMHPDINKDPEAEEQMRNINVAFDGIDKIFESKKANDDLLDSLLKNDSLVLDFVESQHPRGKGGQFAKKNSGGALQTAIGEGGSAATGSKRPRTVKGTATKTAIAASGTTAVAMGAAGLAAAYVIGQAKGAAVDITGFDFPDGGPIDFSRYDDLEPGTMLHKGFETKGVDKGKGMLHFAVYTGKDPKTGEHMCVHSSIDPKHPGTISIIPASIESQFALLSPERQKKSSHYKPVPPSEINPAGTPFTPEQVLERANALVGQPYKYGGVRDNCETIARVIVEGAGRETQASQVGPRAKKIAYKILDTRLSQVRAKSDGRQNAKTASEMADMLSKRKSKDLSDSMSMEMGRVKSEWESANVPEPKPASTNAFRENVFRQAFRNKNKSGQRNDADNATGAGAEAFIESMGMKQPEEFAQDVDEIVGEITNEAMSKLLRKQLWGAYFEVLITSTHVITNGKTGELRTDSARNYLIEYLRQDFTSTLHPRDENGRFKKKSGPGAGGQLRSAVAVTEVQTKAKARTNAKPGRGLAIAAGVTAVAGVGAIAIVGGASAFFKESGEGASDISSLKFPKPDAEYDFSRYDNLEEGSIIRKAFTAPGYPAGKGFLHYAIYKGKDPKTGEHVVIHAVPDPKDPKGAVAIVEQSIEDAVKRGGNAEKHWHSYYETIPEAETRKGPKTPTKAEAVKRAESLVGQPFDYYSVRSNCESFARLIAEGTPYETQGPGVAQSKKDFIANLTKKMQDKARDESPIWKGKQPRTATEYVDILAKMESGELSDSVKAEMQRNRQEWEAAPNQEVSSKTNRSIEQIFGWTLNTLDKLEKKEARRADDGDDFYQLSGMKTPDQYGELVESVVEGSTEVLKKQVRTYLWSNYLQMMVAILKGGEIRKDALSEAIAALISPPSPHRVKTKLDGFLTPRQRYLLLRRDAGFEQSKHPRDENGRFAAKSGTKLLRPADLTRLSPGSGSVTTGEAGKMVSAGRSYTDSLLDDPEIAAASDRMGAATAKMNKVNDKVRTFEGKVIPIEQLQESAQAASDCAEVYNAYKPMMIKKMAALRDELKGDSGVSKQQAEKIVGKKSLTTVPPGFAGRAQLREDLKDYVQLTGNDVSTLNTAVVGLNTRGRSYADPMGSKAIFISGNQFNRSTVFHETTHHLEYASPKLVKASEEWATKRSDGKGEQELRNFVGPSYSPGEKAFRGNYVHPYVGKVYRRADNTAEATEVLSMGMQYFDSPERMAQLYILDPDHFNFTLGAIRPNGRTRKDSLTVRDALIEWLQGRYDFDPGLHTRDERGRFSVKEGDRGMGVWFEGRRTGVLVRAKNKAEAIEKAEKAKKRGGAVGTVRSLTKQEEAIAQKGRWVRTGPNGEKPGELDIPGLGPKPKKLMEQTDD